MRFRATVLPPAQRGEPPVSTSMADRASPPATRSETRQRRIAKAVTVLREGGTQR